MDYMGNDKYEHFMVNKMDAIAEYAKSESARTLEPWKSFWSKFRELGENSGLSHQNLGMPLHKSTALCLRQ